MDKAWAGVDAGKEFHWAHVLDASGTELLSRKVQNDEADILRLIEDALSLAEEVLWAIDQPGGGAALLLAFCGNVSMLLRLRCSMLHRRLETASS